MLTIQSGSLARNGHIRAGRAEGDNIDRLDLTAVHAGDITIVFHKGQTFGSNSDGERLDFGCPQRRNAGEQAAEREPTRAIKQTAKSKILIHG